MFIPTKPWCVNGAQFPVDVPYSCMFDKVDGSNLGWDLASAGDDQKTWTFSTWLKRTNVDILTPIWGCYVNTSGYTNLYIAADGTIKFQSTTVGLTVNGVTARTFKDQTEWYHIFAVYDSTEAVEADRFKLYVNGELVSMTFTATIALNETTYFNSEYVHYVGYGYISGVGWAVGDSIMAETHVGDGVAWDLSDFGQLNVFNQWVPRAPSGLSYGSNGFYFDYADDTDLANNLANANVASANSITSSHQYTDTPTSNYCTLNSAEFHGMSNMRSGGLYPNRSGGAGNYSILGTQLLKGGKWYWENEVVSLGGSISTAGANGIAEESVKLINTIYNEAGCHGFFYASGTWWKGDEGTNTNLGDTNAQGIIIGTRMCIALDLDNGDMWVRQNGNAWVGGGDPALGTSPSITGIDTTKAYQVYMTPYNSAGVDFIMMEANFGQLNGGFVHTAPSGFKAINTANHLPAPDITAPSGHFAPVAYDGSGTTPQNITMDFQPDLTVVKARSFAASWRVIDDVRGTSEEMYWDAANAGATEANGITSFNTDGFTVVNGASTGYNESGGTLVSYNWKEGAIPGFDIVSYTGNGTNQTVGHNLGVVPEMMIVKNRDAATNWGVFHKDAHATPEGQTLFMDVSNALTATATYWNNTAPTSSVFSVGANNATNGSGNDMIAYLFASVPGFSKVGKYVGNGNANGPVVLTGFKPAFVMIKDTTSANSWVLKDSARNPENSVDEVLYPDLTNAESTNHAVEFLANGFKLRENDTTYNTSNNTYVFLAFAEMPFEYGRAA